MVIPHIKSGIFSKHIERFSRCVEYIDDGLDTFRESPKNLNLDTLRGGAYFYTFRYPFSKAGWTSKLIPVELGSYFNDPGRGVGSILKQYKTLVVDSPGTLNLEFDFDAGLGVIPHPSALKKREFNKDREFVQLNGMMVEDVVRNFLGNIIIGETLVLIYLLSIGKHQNLSVYLDRASYENLSCLHSELNKVKSLTLLQAD